MHCRYVYLVRPQITRTEVPSWFKLHPKMGKDLGGLIMGSKPVNEWHKDDDEVTQQKKPMYSKEHLPPPPPPGSPPIPYVSRQQQRLQHTSLRCALCHCTTASDKTNAMPSRNRSMRTYHCIVICLPRTYCVCTTVSQAEQPHNIKPNQRPLIG